MTDSPLPAYDNPPVVEIVAAAQFAPLPVFGLAEIVTLGRTFKGWRVVDAPPAIPPMVELTPGQPSATAMGFSFGQPPLRLVLTAGEGAWTAQLQQDRVAVHEHRITARPSFARVEPRLREVARLASEALGREVLGAEHPAEYVELVYDNRIPAADGGWSTFRDLHRVLQVVAPTPADPPYDEVEQLTVAFSEVLQKNGEFVGRLRVIAEPLFDEAGEPLLHLRIVSRRLVQGGTVEDVPAACHVDIVEGFTAGDDKYHARGVGAPALSVVSRDITTAERRDELSPGITWVGERPGDPADAAEPRFVELERLEPDWDGYGAQSIDARALRAARAVLGHPAFRDLPAPEVFPLPSGGVQLEWAAGPLELELEVEPGGATAVFVCDEEGTHYRFDGVLPGDEQRLQLALARLAAHR